MASDLEAGECFNRAMTAVSSLTSDAIVAAYDFDVFTRIVDVGGGHGRLLAAVAGRVRKAARVLFDLPEVVFASAGFALTRVIPTAGPTSMVEGAPR